jgi:hypothetical protein
MSDENPWAEFTSARFKIVDLGRPAIFLIPAIKLALQGKEFPTLKEDLEHFLLANFEAFTTSKVPNFGVWKNAENHPVEDACIQYEVSFKGKHRIPLLLEKLTELLILTGEDCFYVKAGQYTMLLSSTKPSS